MFLVCSTKHTNQCTSKPPGSPFSSKSLWVDLLLIKQQFASLSIWQTSKRTHKLKLTFTQAPTRIQHDNSKDHLFAPRGMAWRTENRVFPLNICSSHIHQHRPKRPLSELTSVVRIELYSKFESCLTPLENGSISPGAQSNWIMLDKLNFMVLHPREAPRGLSFARKPAEKYIFMIIWALVSNGWVGNKGGVRCTHTRIKCTHTQTPKTNNKRQEAKWSGKIW